MELVLIYLSSLGFPLVFYHTTTYQSHNKVSEDVNMWICLALNKQITGENMEIVTKAQQIVNGVN